MTKEEQRKALEAMMAGKTITKLPAQEAQEDSLSASFKAKGIDKKRQDVKKPKAKQPKAKQPKRVKPNWELQRRYDEMHGTVNGYDPDIEAWNDFHRNEMEG